MSKEDEIIGEKIRQLRIINHKKQEDIGEVIGANKQTVSRIERGLRSVSYIELAKLAEYFKEPIDVFTEKHAKFKFILTKNSTVAVPKFYIDFIKDYEEFLTQEDLEADAVQLINDELITRINNRHRRRFTIWKKP